MGCGPRLPAATGLGQASFPGAVRGAALERGHRQLQPLPGARPGAAAGPQGRAAGPRAGETRAARRPSRSAARCERLQLDAAGAALAEVLESATGRLGAGCIASPSQPEKKRRFLMRNFNSDA